MGYYCVQEYTKYFKFGHEFINPNTHVFEIKFLKLNIPFSHMIIYTNSKFKRVICRDILCLYK